MTPSEPQTSDLICFDPLLKLPDLKSDEKHPFSYNKKNPSSYIEMCIKVRIPSSDQNNFTH